MPCSSRLWLLSVGVLALIPCAPAKATSVAYGPSNDRGDFGNYAVVDAAEPARTITVDFRSKSDEYLIRSDDPISYHRFGYGGESLPGDECENRSTFELSCRFPTLELGLEVAGTSGDDSLRVSVPHAVTQQQGYKTRIMAGAGNDHVEGGAGGDWIHEGEGDGIVRGGGGRDDLLGEAGSDKLVGNIGDDVLIGHARYLDATGQGEDLLLGGKGDDVLGALVRDSQTTIPMADRDIDCGPGVDIARIDRLDPRPEACETVKVR